MMHLLAIAIDELSIELASAGVRLLGSEYRKELDVVDRFVQNLVVDRIRRGPTPVLIFQGHPLS